MSVFSDPRIQEALKDFIPLAQNTHYTQNRREKDELNRYFWKSVSSRCVEGQDRTTQGFYTYNAAGVAYGGTNSRFVDRVLRLIREAKAQFDADPPAKLDLLENHVSVKPRPPENSVVVAVFSRIQPLPPGAPYQNGFIGRDYLWILPDEIEQLTQGVFPATLQSRLARFHLWDNVRGEPDAWSPEQIRLADFKASATREGENIRVRIQGPFAMLAPAGRGEHELPEMGYEGTIEGELLIGGSGREIRELQMIAEGTAWGRSTYTSHPPAGRFPLKIAFVPARGEISRETPPQGLIWGADQYMNSRLP